MLNSHSTTTNEKKTRDIGRTLATHLLPGDILLLHGELGAGKTTLVKGIAEGLGVKDEITSPTFTLMNVYEIKSEIVGRENQHLIHIDTYRLEEPQELLDIGVTDYLGASDTICIIEWPEKIASLLEEIKCIFVELKHVALDEREIIIHERTPFSFTPMP